jgi:hypothetical protein
MGGMAEKPPPPYHNQRRRPPPPPPPKRPQKPLRRAPFGGRVEMLLSFTKFTHAMLATMRIDLANRAGEVGRHGLQLVHAAARFASAAAVWLLVSLACARLARIRRSTRSPPYSRHSPTSANSLLLGGSESGRERAIPCGSYSSKTAYRTFFHGKMALPGVTNVWNSFAPLKFKMHAWLSLQWRCWTADHRRRRGLPMHIMCPLCGSQEETIDHLTLQWSLCAGGLDRGRDEAQVV